MPKLVTKTFWVDELGGKFDTYEEAKKSDEANYYATQFCKGLVNESLSEARKVTRILNALNQKEEM